MGQYLVVGIVAFLAFLGGMLDGCESSSGVSNAQQEKGVLSIVKNQPVPDLGGYSFDRQIVIDTYLARNKGVATYSYLWSPYTGKFFLICPSRGYGIPFSTQLTQPVLYNGSSNPEPNSLFPPTSAAATFVICVNADGSVSPQYVEENVEVFTFVLKNAEVLQRDDSTSFKITVPK